MKEKCKKGKTLFLPLSYSPFSFLFEKAEKEEEKEVEERKNKERKYEENFSNFISFLEKEDEMEDEEEIVLFSFFLFWKKIFE